MLIRVITETSWCLAIGTLQASRPNLVWIQAIFPRIGDHLIKLAVDVDDDYLRFRFVGLADVVQAGFQIFRVLG